MSEAYFLYITIFVLKAHTEILEKYLKANFLDYFRIDTRIEDHPDHDIYQVNDEVNAMRVSEELKNIGIPHDLQFSIENTDYKSWAYVRFTEEGDLIETSSFHAEDICIDTVTLHALVEKGFMDELVKLVRESFDSLQQWEWTNQERYSKTAQLKRAISPKH